MTEELEGLDNEVAGEIQN